MYEYFEQLLQLKGVSVADVCKATGISPSVISLWKKRNSVLSGEHLLTLAKYFDVPMEYFFGSNEINWNPKTQEMIIENADMQTILSLYKNKEVRKSLMAYVNKLYELHILQHNLDNELNSHKKDKE